MTASFAEPLLATQDPAIAFGGAGAGFFGAVTTVRVSDSLFTYSATVSGATGQAGNPYNVTVTASTVVDAASNTQTALPAAASGTVDTVPPDTSTLTFSRGPSYLAAGALRITVDFNEALTSTITPTMLFAPSARFETLTVNRINNTRFWYNTSVLTPTSLAGDSYSLTITQAGVVDNAGNTQTNPAESRSGVIDTQAPTVISLVYSKVPPIYRAEAFVVTATFNEDITPTAAKLTIPGGNFGGSAVSNAPMTDTGDHRTFTYSRTIAASGDTQGIRTLTVAGTDPAGNVNPSTPSNTVTVDTAAPTSSGTFTVCRSGGSNGTGPACLSWTGGLDPAPSSGIWHYRIYWRDSADAMSEADFQTTTTTTSYTDSAPPNNRRYFVGAVDNAGNRQVVPSSGTLASDCSCP
jgi:hypothetical protein